ncbi:MAG: rod shape-determining protein RodA [Crocinitomicaceae bacterium]
MRKNETILDNIDWSLILLYFVLTILGLFNIYSASFNEEYPSIFSFSQEYGKQIIWIAISMFLGFIVLLLEKDVLWKYAYWFYGFCMFLLVAVLFTREINGARSWLGVGSMGIQPSEFAKLGTAIAISAYISGMNIKLQSQRSAFYANMIVVFPMLLILLQPDAGTFIVFTSFLWVFYREGISYDFILGSLLRLIPFVDHTRIKVGSNFIPLLVVSGILVVSTLLLSQSSIQLFGYALDGYWGLIVSIGVFLILALIVVRLTVMLRERKKLYYVLIVAAIASSSLVFAVNSVFGYLKSHQKERIELFLGLDEDPDGKDYNRNRAMAAVGSGGFFGKGYHEATLASPQQGHVPMQSTDFIFCTLAEEWGFVGGLIVLSLFIVLLFKIIQIAERQRSTFTRVFAYSVAVIIFYHLAINIGMTIGLAPVIGIPLPFFSYGGSSLMSFTMMLFVLAKLDSERKNVFR